MSLPAIEANERAQLPAASAPTSASGRRAAAARLTDLIRQALAAIGGAWSRLWFQNTTTLPLEIARIGIGATVLIHYAMATRHLFEFWSDEGFLPLAVALQRREQPWEQSLHFYFSAPWQLVALHAVFHSWWDGEPLGSNGSSSSARSPMTHATPCCPMASISFFARFCSSFASPRSAVP
jgi:hypothetical protein